MILYFRVKLLCKFFGVDCLIIFDIKHELSCTDAHADIVEKTFGNDEKFHFWKVKHIFERVATNIFS